MIAVARRSFITGLIALVAAPAIVRVSSIMPVKAMTSVETLTALLEMRVKAAEALMVEQLKGALYGDLKYASPGSFQRYSGYMTLGEVFQLADRATGVAIHG